jgi:hypothetical protein
MDGKANQGRFTGADGAPLGLYGRSHTALESKGVFPESCKTVVDQGTGEVFEFRQGREQSFILRADPASTRLDRFAMQSVARSILPGSQTAKCLRVPFRPTVDVLYSPSTGSASFGGLVTCHSVWACPICAAKISERRRVEIQAAMTAWKAQGGSVVLLTLTHGHGPWDPLSGLLRGEDQALKRFFGCRQGVDLMSALGRVGHIRAWEVTHGRLRAVSNGWHPHFHILLFLRSSHHDLEWAEDWAFRIWHNACRLSGLSLPSRSHGVKLEDGSRAAAYVSKMGLEDPPSAWGLDAEMTKGHIKRARDGETPFDFLRACLAGEDPQARALFREFAGAFKGKKQLVWSRGLRERLGVDLVTDEELAGTHEDDAEILGRLSDQDWRLVLRFDVRGELLELARHGWEPVERFLQSLKSMGVKS